MSKRLRIYECTLYSKAAFGDPRPVVIDGCTMQSEKVAESAGQARYQLWSEIRDFDSRIRISDIRVKSLAKRKAAPMVGGWQARLEIANQIIQVIAKYGRNFLSENSDKPLKVANPYVSRFFVDEMGELWFIDSYTRKPILVRQEGKWRHFSGGGTLRGVVKHLAEHIGKNQPVNMGYFSPAEYWGYDDDMPIVAREIAALLGRSEERKAA